MIVQSLPTGQRKLSVILFTVHGNAEVYLICKQDKKDETIFPLTSSMS